MKLEKLGPVGTYRKSQVVIATPACAAQSNCLSRSGLCFSGFLRLSGMTRVPAGARPDLRARRRASVPFSSRFFFRFTISILFRRNLRNRSPALIDGFIRISEHARIRVGNVNISKGLAADFVRRLSRGPFRVEQGHIFV